MLAAPTSPVIDSLWSALSRLGVHPAPAWRWRQMLGTSPDECRFLKRVAMLADRVPCPHACGCGQLHRVEQIEPGDFCAIPMEPDCEPAPVSRDELAVFALDSVRFAAAVARALAIRPEISVIGDSVGTHRLGLRVDGTPVYLSFPLTSEGAISCVHFLAASTRSPFTLIVSTERVITNGVRTLLAAQGATGAAVADHVTVAAADTLKFAAPLPALPNATSVNSPPLNGRSSFGRGNVWPHARPDEPKWSDVTITLHLQEAFVRFGNSQRSFDFREIDGFSDRRGGKRPNRLWLLLRAFAMKGGTLPLQRKRDDPVRVRTLSDLEALLSRFFGIRTPAFDRRISERVAVARFRLLLKT